MVKLSSRTEELARKLTKRHFLEPVPSQWNEIWMKCRKEGVQLCPELERFWGEPILPDIATLQRLSAILRSTLNHNVNLRREERRRAWHEQFMADFKATRTQSFDFVRGAEQSAIPWCNALTAR